MRKALLPPDSMRNPGDPGCSIHDGEGEPLGALAACPRGRSGRTFAPRGSAHGTHIVIVSTILGATDGGLATPLRTRRSRRAVNPRCSNSWQACTARSRYRWVRRGSLPAFARKSRGLSHVARPRRAREKRRPTQRHGRKRPPACAGEDRTLEVMLARRSSLQKSTDSVLAKTGERAPFHPIWKRSPTVA